MKNLSLLFYATFLLFAFFGKGLCLKGTLYEMKEANDDQGLQSNPCASNPCKNGGTCYTFGHNLSKCICPEGFTGPRCIQDVDECQYNNSGCQDLCVNTKGGHHCACSDPELSVAPNNRSCIAEGIGLECGQNDMTIFLPKSLLKGVDRHHLILLDRNCRAYENQTHFIMTTQLIGCNTKLRYRGNFAVYSNMVTEIPLEEDQIVTRIRDIMIPFHCFYSKWGVVSSIGIKPVSKKIIFSSKGYGKFTLTLDLFKSSAYQSAYTQDDFPVALTLREQMYFEVRVDTEDSRLSILALDCFATPSQDRNAEPRYDIIKDGCLVDDTGEFIFSPDPQSQRWTLEAFTYVGNHPFVFIHCKVKVCNATDPNSRCIQGCQPRKRRNVKALPDTTDDVYPLAQGPLTLNREKTQADVDKAIESNRSVRVVKRGIQMPIVAALAVVIGVCIAGIFYMTCQKKREENVRRYQPIYIDEHQ